MYDKRNDIYVATDTGGGPFARNWCTAKAGLADLGYLKATGHSIQMVLPKSLNMPEMELEWKIPPWSNAVERDRARTYHQPISALIGLYNLEKALIEVRAGRTVYCASKHAMEGFTKAMAIELAPHDIRVNSLGPTFIETPLTKPFFENEAFRKEVLSKIKLGRIGQMDELTGAIVFLASDASRLMTGSALVVDGGWTAE